MVRILNGKDFRKVDELKRYEKKMESLSEGSRGKTKELGPKGSMRDTRRVTKKERFQQNAAAKSLRKTVRP